MIKKIQNLFSYKPNNENMMNSIIRDLKVKAQKEFMSQFMTPNKGDTVQIKTNEFGVVYEKSVYTSKGILKSFIKKPKDSKY